MSAVKTIFRGLKKIPLIGFVFSLAGFILYTAALSQLASSLMDGKHSDEGVDKTIAITGLFLSAFGIGIVAIDEPLTGIIKIIETSIAAFIGGLALYSFIAVVL